MPGTVNIIAWIILIMIIIVSIIIILLVNKKATDKVVTAQKEADDLISKATKDADNIRHEAKIKSNKELKKLKSTQEREYNTLKNELKNKEYQLFSREKNIITKESDVSMREKDVTFREKEATLREKDISKKQFELDTKFKEVELLNRESLNLIEKQKEKLESIANLTAEEAKNFLIDAVKDETESARASIIRENERIIKEDSKKIAKEIITRTIQRFSSEFVAESTLSVVSLPSEDMKGRIIGREGRNIKSFETITEVDLIIDDTPLAVVLSCFNPIRRAIAKLTLEKLIEDGRIHPTRIEEQYEKAKLEIEREIFESGSEALMQAGIQNRMHPELIKLVGALKFRTSFGQNALKHSIEVARLAGMLANEIGCNEKISIRGGLLHDIGKAIDHNDKTNNVESHVQLGIEACEKYKESPEVIHCVASHHNDVEPTTLEALIVQAADALSAGRPGARRESLEYHIQRLQELENLVQQFDGIDSCYAIQAGREVRAFVKPNEISDDQMTILSMEISKKVEEELNYPGQIKINLIRECKAVSIAK